jgi:hypothetical protein
MRYPRLPRPVLSALLALSLLCAAAALLASGGYTIVLKDGSTIIAKEKYRIEGNRAIITQLNGTQTFVRADQIDAARTEAANRTGYGSAVVIPGSPQDVGTPPAQIEKDKTLADLARGGAAAHEIPTTRRDKGEAVPGRLIKTKAGYLDLSTLPRKPYIHAELTAEIQQFFRGQGIEEVEIYEGTQGDRPLLEITTNSEGSVFKALGTAANGLLHMRDAFPGKIAAFEVLLTTPSRERAGQFVLTPEMATDLISRKVDVTAFFVKNVQF